MNLANKVALITGGTKGIGAAAALALAKEGMDVSLVARRIDDEAKKTRDAIIAGGRRCELIGADCGKPDEARHAVEETAARLGDPNVLVHSAGGPVNGGLFDLTPEM